METTFDAGSAHDASDHSVAGQQETPKPQDIIFTYENLWEILRKEKDRFEIQKLSDTFYFDVLTYLREKHAMLEATKNKVDIFSADERQKLQLQIQNARRVLRELYERREKKIIDMTLNKSRTGSDLIDTSTLLPEERTLYDAMLHDLDSQRTKLLHNILSLKHPEIIFTSALIEEPAQKTRHVKFVQTIDQALIGPNLESYGPFNIDDAAYLPVDVAELLVAQGSATYLD